MNLTWLAEAHRGGAIVLIVVWSSARSKAGETPFHTPTPGRIWPRVPIFPGLHDPTAHVGSMRVLCEDRSLLRQSLPAAQLLPRAFRRVAVPRCPSRTPASTRAARRPIVAAVSTLNQQSRPQQTPGRGSALASQPSNDNTHASSFVYTRFHWPTELGGENIFVWGEQGAAAAGKREALFRKHLHGNIGACPGQLHEARAWRT